MQISRMKEALIENKESSRVVSCRVELSRVVDNVENVENLDKVQLRIVGLFDEKSHIFCIYG